MHNNIEKNLWIHWNMSGDEIIRETKKLINKSTNNNEMIINLKIYSKDSCHQFLQLVSDDVTEYNTFHSMCSFLQFVSPDPIVRKNSYIADLMLTNYVNQLNLRKDIYDKIVEFYKKASNYIKLDRCDIQFLKKIMTSYERNGVKLNERDRNVLLKVKQEISKIEKYISKFIHDNENKVIGMTPKELDGLPQYYINALPIVNNNPLRYGVTIDRVKYQQYMKYINNAQIRKNMEQFYSGQCSDIIDDIARLIVLKDKYAKLLGYDNYSDYKSSNQVAKNSENIKNFLTELLHKLDFRYSKEMNTLLRVKKENNNNNNNCINSWDLQYYINKWKKEYGLNDNEARKYFPLKHVLYQILDIYQKLFKIEFVKIEEPFVWHNDVVMYAVYDKSGFEKEIVGYLYLDLFNRPGKHKDTRCFSLLPACIFPLKMNRYQIPIVALTASLEKTKHILLSHAEIISLFHEFGHVMHHIFGKTKYSIFSGTNVEFDFVETPAQILENLCWNKDILKKLSYHYKTGDKLPYNIIEKMIKVKGLNIGLSYKYNIMIAIYDQLIHSSENFIDICENIVKADEDEKISQNRLANTFVNLYKQLYGQIMSSSLDKNSVIVLNEGMFLPIEWTNFICTGGAQQYGYIWSKIYSDDVYNDILKRYKLKDRINLNFGLNFKDKILIHGGTREAMQILTSFLDRKPKIDGFLDLHQLETNVEFSFFLNTEQLNKNHQNNKKSENIMSIDFSDSTDSEEKSTQVSASINRDVYSNRFSEINLQETSRNTNDRKSNKDKNDHHYNDITFIKSKLEDDNLGADNYVTENTETLAKYKKIFIKN